MTNVATQLARLKRRLPPPPPSTARSPTISLLELYVRWIPLEELKECREMGRKATNRGLSDSWDDPAMRARIQEIATAAKTRAEAERFDLFCRKTNAANNASMA